MINCTREPNTPASLETQPIKDYLDALSDHLADPTNVAKPNKPPTYRNSDLLDAFDRCFYSKCYLTEQKFDNSYPMDIEHFVSKSERPELRYTWTNLFPADHNTNMFKPRNTPVGGYFDPCDRAHDVENEIVYTLDLYGEAPKFDPRDPANTRAVNTCNLLDRVHNGHDENTTKSTQTLRHSIQKKHITILNKIVEYQNAVDGSQDKFQLRREIKDLLSRTSSFTMLCRSGSAVRTVLTPDFFD